MPSSSMILCTEKNKRWNSNPHGWTIFQNWKDEKQGIYFVWPKTEELLNNFSLEQPKLVIFLQSENKRNKISVGNIFLMFFISFNGNFGGGGLGSKSMKFQRIWPKPGLRKNEKYWHYISAMNRAILIL